MSTPEQAVSAEELVLQLTRNYKGAIRNFYNLSQTEFTLDRTNRGQLAFTWDALYDDGSKHYQYDEVTFYRALTDETFIPSVDKIVSTGVLDKKRTVEFNLYPIAFTRKSMPWFQHPYTVVVKPNNGERLLAFWEVDYRPQSNSKLYRTAIGIAVVNPEDIYVDGENKTYERELSRSVVVFSPSGSITLANSTNVSFEGE